MAKKNKSGVMENEILKVMRLDKDAELPEYALDCDVALDLRANEEAMLEPMEQKEIKTGVAIEIPEGYIGLVRDRAGIITKMGIHVVAGTFNSAYRGEVSVFMINFSGEEVNIEKGMRIAQMIVVPINKLKIEEVKSLSKTQRSGKEIGHTGLNEMLSALNELAAQGDKKMGKGKKGK